MRGCRSGQTGKIKALVVYPYAGSNPVPRIYCIIFIGFPIERITLSPFFNL